MRKLLLVLIFIAGCDSVEEEDRPRAYRVDYHVKGTAEEVFVTYANSNGGTSQVTAPVPWSTGFQAMSGHFLYVSAQNSGDKGTVITEIAIDGKAYKQSQSEGAYVIASSSGSLP